MQGFGNNLMNDINSLIHNASVNLLDYYFKNLTHKMHEKKIKYPF